MSEDEFPPVTFDIRRILHGHVLGEDVVMFGGMSCPMCDWHETVVVLDIDAELAAA